MPEPARAVPRRAGTGPKWTCFCPARGLSSPRKSQIESERQFRRSIDWLALIRLAMRHDVMPLLYRNLQQVCPDAVPDDIFGPASRAPRSASGAGPAPR